MQLSSLSEILHSVSHSPTTEGTNKCLPVRDIGKNMRSLWETLQTQLRCVTNRTHLYLLLATTDHSDRLYSGLLVTRTSLWCSVDAPIEL